jgi:hypothetical protein
MYRIRWLIPLLLAVAWLAPVAAQQLVPRLEWELPLHYRGLVVVDWEVPDCPASDPARPQAIRIA